MQQIKERADKQFLQAQEKQISVLYKKLQLDYWDAAITGKEEAYQEYEKSAIEFKRFFNNKENFEKIKEFLKEKTEGDIVARQLKILHDSYLSNQGDFKLLEKMTKIATEIEKKFNTFRAKLKGKELTDNNIKDILKKETNSEKLKEVWEASKKQGRLVEKELLELVRLRNQLAKSLGFRDYYQLSLEASEQKEEEIEKIFKELEELTDKPFKKLKSEIDEFLSKKYKIPEKELKPWHYGDLFFQRASNIYGAELDSFYIDDILKKSKKYYGSIGLGIKDILERSDLYEKKGKYQHACCMDMDRKGDVRTIQNLKNNEYWMETLLHELGHGVYSKYIDHSLPFILIDSAHTFTTEAIAMLFGRKSSNPSFIKNYCKPNEKETKKISQVNKMLKTNELVFSRWAQVMFHFERQLYKAPEQNLNELWWSIVKKYQLIDFSRNEPDWASKIHLVSAPVYYHNYMLGELLASQLHNYITKNIIKTKDTLTDYSGKKEVGKWLIKNIFEPGAKYRWDELIKKATHEPLTTKYFVEEFAKEN